MSGRAPQDKPSSTILTASRRCAPRRSQDQERAPVSLDRCRTTRPQGRTGNRRQGRPRCQSHFLPHPDSRDASNFDRTDGGEPQVETVNRDISKAKSDAEAYAKSAKADTLKKIDEFDRKVEEGASKSKGYFSSWFGGK